MLADDASAFAGLMLFEAVKRAVSDGARVSKVIALCADVAATDILWLDALRNQRFDFYWYLCNPRSDYGTADMVAKRQEALFERYGFNAPKPQEKLIVSDVWVNSSDDLLYRHRRVLKKTVEKRLSALVDHLRSRRLIADGFDPTLRKTVEIDAGVWASPDFFMHVGTSELHVDRAVSSPAAYQSVTLRLPQVSGQPPIHVAPPVGTTSSRGRGRPESYDWPEIVQLVWVDFIENGTPTGKEKVDRVLGVMIANDMPEPKRDTIEKAMRKHMRAWTRIT